MSPKSTVEANIDKILNRKNLTIYKLSKEIKVKDSALYGMVKGRSKFSEKFIKKLLPLLEVSKEEFESWILADEYPEEVLKRAIHVRKEFPYKRKSVLTVNIDKILYEKYMSRTDLAKQINYSQSGLNRMITGKINMSKSVMERVATALEIPQDEILSWTVADKYNLNLLEAAHSCLTD